MAEKKNDVSRRGFMKDAAKVAAGVAVGAAASKVAKADVYKSILPQTVIGANEKLLTGHIGVGRMGKRNIQFCLLRDDIQPNAVCDLSHLHWQQATDLVPNK